MNLSPEEKQIGKDNFNEAVGTTRRDFLKGTVIAGAAAGVEPGVDVLRLRAEDRRPAARGASWAPATKGAC